MFRRGSFTITEYNVYLSKNKSSADWRTFQRMTRKRFWTDAWPLKATLIIRASDLSGIPNRSQCYGPSINIHYPVIHQYCGRELLIGLRERMAKVSLLFTPSTLLYVFILNFFNLIALDLPQKKNITRVSFFSRFVLPPLFSSWTENHFIMATVFI